ncbi:hypothetical protein QF035_008839 [Streptomyces umbrinus]|uniref:Zinc finger CHCC-type domain-containing protein n=1 Tax=Streptomyces umbrinus TaxID=67370 RepID=A0ABU0T6H4_9ACTN|nr:hypothetical protein [Streptomyces umbrinus]
MSAAHRGSGAVGVLEGPARTGHFTAGRPSSSLLTRFARTSGDDGVDLGNYATAHNPDPVPYEPEGEREHFCEPCGISYVSTNRIKRLNGVLLKGIV